MLGKNIIVKMFDYNHFTNNRLLDHAANVKPGQWDAPQEAGQRSLHETLFHILVVEEEWLVLCRDRKHTWGERPITDFPDIASLRAFSDQTYAAIRAHLESLDEAQMVTRISGLFPDGLQRSVIQWDILTHMLFHSAQHRSEVAAMLTRFGHSPGNIDYYGFGGW